ARAGEERDENAGERHRRFEHEQEFRPVVLRPEGRMREQQREAGRQQPGQDDFAPQPGLQLSSLPLHMGLVGRRAAADKECMAARVLVVDDHPLTREALAALLRSHGFELAGIAADGEEAIAAAAETQPDLVLLDLLMPGLDGLSALPRLREAAPECEVVILTASGTEENLLAAIR